MSDTFSSELLREMESAISIDEDNIEHSYVVNVNFELINGFRIRKDSFLIWDRDEQQLYYKNSLSKKRQAVGYTCRIKGCTARVFYNGTTVIRELDSVHLRSHGSQYHVYKQMWCENKMKERALTAPLSMDPSEIYLEAVNE